MPNPAVKVGGDDAPPFDFWPYFEAIPSADFEGHDCSAGHVDWVYRDGGGRWEHVLVTSDMPSTFMVIVLDLAAGQVHGHHLLDLNKRYGLTGTD